MLRLDGATKMLKECLNNLEREGLIHPAIVKKNVIKAILKNKPIGLLAHLRDKYPSFERKLREYIKSIYEFNIADLERIIGEV